MPSLNIPVLAIALLAAQPVEEPPAMTQPSTEDAPTALVVRVQDNDAEPVTAFELPKGGTGYACGGSRVTTPLPEGYPAPTAIGAVERKTYPSVRRAEIAMSGESGMFGGGSTRAFFPLFRHITSRNIAMTAPVEIDYAQGQDNTHTPSAMSFLYRVPENGRAGEDGDITVYDTQRVTVLSLGLRGPMNNTRVNEAISQLRAILDNDPAWRAAGDPRSLGYNGPDTRPDLRWSEVQIPVEPANADDEMPKEQAEKDGRGDEPASEPNAPVPGTDPDQDRSTTGRSS